MSWYTVGHVKDAHGLNGEVYILIYSGELSWLEQIKELQLLSPVDDHDIVIKKILRANPHKKGFIARLSDVTDRTAAEKLKKFKVQIPESLLASKPGENIFLNEIMGFTVIDQNQIVRGKIVDFAGSSFQDLVVLENDQGRFDVPLVEEFIVKIDDQEKKIFMDLPEGLFE